MGRDAAREIRARTGNLQGRVLAPTARPIRPTRRRGGSGPRSARRRAPAGIRGDRQADDEGACPAPSPSLRASTVPPCIATRRRTTLRPMPSPALALSRRLGATCANISKTARQQVGGDADAVVLDRDAGVSPVRLDRQADVAAAHGCTWRRCSRGSRRPGSAVVSSPSTGIDPEGKTTSSIVCRTGRSAANCFPPPAGRWRSGPAAPCGARSCPGRSG